MDGMREDWLEGKSVGEYSIGEGLVRGDGFTGFDEMARECMHADRPVTAPLCAWTGFHSAGGE